MSACETLAYSEFGSRLLKATAGRRVPLHGSFELTFKCNLRCVHCYVPDFSGRGELATEEWTRIFDETADAGCLYVLLTGGEVLLRPDFERLYRHAKGRGLLVTVFSNGTRFDERVADLFADYPPFGLEFTLYGMSDATYETTTGRPRGYTRVRRAVELCVERGIRLTLKTVAMDALRGEVGAMRAWAESLGVPFRYDGTIHGRLDGSLQPTAARARPADVVAMDARDPGRREAWLRFYRSWVRTFRPSGALLTCGAGYQAFHVDPKGTLLSCEALPLEPYDLRSGSFREGWETRVAAVRLKRAAPVNVCSPCEIKPLCDRCPATATLETGSPDGWIPWYCEVTHRRAALIESEMGNEERAARYLAHAEKVASGWTPEGAILPRASARPAAPSCESAGGCAAGGCRAAAPGTARTTGHAPMQIVTPARAVPPSSGPREEGLR